MKTYPLKVEKLPKLITLSEVRDFFDGPSADILEDSEIFSNWSCATAILVLTRPDVAYEFLNYKKLEIQGNRITVVPEFIEETSITLNGSWLREIEDEDPEIQFEIRKIADQFQLQLDFCKSEHRETISLTGAPWRMEKAKISLSCKFQDIIKSRSQNLKKESNKNHFQPDVARIQSAGNNEPEQSTKVDDLSAINEDGKPASKLDDPQSSVDAKPDVENKGSTERDNSNTGKRRVRTLKTGDPKPETSAVVATVSNNDVITDQPKEVKRSRVLVTKTEELQTSESSVDPLDKSTPVNYPTSTQYQAAVRVHSDIHTFLLEHNKHLNFTDCSIGQNRVSEQHIDWVIGNNNKKDLRRNEDLLKSLLDKLRIKCYSVPAEFDFEIFKDFIESNNKNDNVTLIFNPKERSCKVVGLSNDAKDTHKWLIKISDEFLQKTKQKPGKGSATDINDDSRSTDKGRSAHKMDAQQSGSQSGSQDFKSDIGNMQGRFPDPKEKVTKASDGIRISQSSKDRLEFTTRGNLKVSVYQGNMIKQPTEVIVNPANDQLAHGGGLARVILDAGGPVIDQESRDIISKQGKLQTSEVVHTSAGKLPAPIKYVIHAVGPTAHEFKDNKAGLVPTMMVTFRNCIEYANDKLGVSSISLPPISAGIFAVPMPDIIQGAVEAIQGFDRSQPSAVLKEVHIISNDAKSTEDMISCFLKVIG